MPAAPAPRQTIFAVSSVLPCTWSALMQAGADDDGGAVLVVVEHRDVELLLQRGFDLEAVRRGDVFQIDAAEGWRDRLDHLDELLRRLRVDLDVVDVDAGELLEQHALPSITGLAASGPRSPRPRMAVPSVITATRLPLLV
jgi:hypothetical protein